jgi:hypothetical protein
VISASRLLSLCLLGVLAASPSFAEVAAVTITSRSIVADGAAFGRTGSYEKLVGRIEFALDPDHARNRAIADLQFAPRGADGRVRFSSDLFVLRPADPEKGNGVLLFEIANRGNKSLLGAFNRAARSDNPTTQAEFGDGLLMREGYTLVWVGWEFDVRRPLLRIEAPNAVLPAAAMTPIAVDLLVNERTAEALLTDDPVRPGVVYPPADAAASGDRLTVRDLYWDEPVVIPRDRWRFLVDPPGLPRIRLDGGFEPGRRYRITYRPKGAVVAGVGLAAIRDAASAFRHRSDMPVRGRAAYAFGQSQAGRFLRQFLYDGFNVDESGRLIFDALWIHKAGAARGSFNERFAIPGLGDEFDPTLFPFADEEEAEVDGRRDGLLSRYAPAQRPRIVYTNTPVEYWGGGRAAALAHVSVDGSRDLTLPDNVRMYVLAGTQHTSGLFPPSRAPGGLGPRARNDGQELSNPTPQDNVMRALLRAWHAWAAEGTPPPASRYPRLDDGTLVPAHAVRFPALRGVADPRRITGPARVIDGRVTPLPFLVPQVDADGNDVAGVHDPEAAVPLATVTGWNFRHERIGNPRDIYMTLGSYIPFPRTEKERKASGDPRQSIEQRYQDGDDYVAKVRAAAVRLIRDRYMLEGDLDGVIARARAHWEFAAGRTTEPGR